jgi:tetratricopeptide (TPR) repeat protein
MQSLHSVQAEIYSNETQSTVADDTNTTSYIQPSVSLDGLFQELREAPSEHEAKKSEEAILRMLHQSGSATATLLLKRASAAIQAGDQMLALDLLDSVIALEPEFAEAWNKRATLHYLRADYGKAIADIEQTLVLEPRHFGAISGLGLIMRSLGRDEAALEIFTEVLEIHPFLEGAKKAVDELRPTLQGQDI